VAFRRLTAFFLSGTGNSDRAARWLVEDARELGIVAETVAIDRAESLPMNKLGANLLWAFYKLRKTISTGKDVFVYFDIATGLLMMEEEFGENGRMVNLFFDHRDVGDVLLPQMRVRLADFLDTAHVGLLSYEANPPLDGALFEPKIGAQ